MGQASAKETKVNCQSQQFNSACLFLAASVVCGFPSPAWNVSNLWAVRTTASLGSWIGNQKSGQKAEDFAHLFSLQSKTWHSDEEWGPTSPLQWNISYDVSAICSAERRLVASSSFLIASSIWVKVFCATLSHNSSFWTSSRVWHVSSAWNSQTWNCATSTWMTKSGTLFFFHIEPTPHPLIRHRQGLTSKENKSLSCKCFLLCFLAGTWNLVLLFPGSALFSYFSTSNAQTCPR